jgi:hypothetical protein
MISTNQPTSYKGSGDAKETIVHAWETLRNLRVYDKSCARILDATSTVSVYTRRAVIRE